MRVGHVVELQGRKGVVTAQDGERLVVEVAGISQSVAVTGLKIVESLDAGDDVNFCAIVFDVAERLRFHDERRKFGVRLVEGKGLGVIATSPIHMETKLKHEKEPGTKMQIVVVISDLRFMISKLYNLDYTL